MSNRVKELLEAASVLSGAGDKTGALRLVDEALRLSPGDARARAVRDEIAPPVGTPFASPPADLFADAAPKISSNPFARPAARVEGMQAAVAPAAPASPADALGDLLHSAMKSLAPGPQDSALPLGRAPENTDPFAKPLAAASADPYLLPKAQPKPSSSTDPYASVPIDLDLDAPPSGGTIPFASQTSSLKLSGIDLDAPPSGGTIPFASQTSSLKLSGIDLDAPPSGGTIPFASQTSSLKFSGLDLDAAPSGGTIPFASQSSVPKVATIPNRGEGESAKASGLDLDAAPSGGTIPFAKQTSSLKASGLDLDAAPSGGTIPFAQRPSAPKSSGLDLNAAPSGGTIPFAQRPSAPKSSGLDLDAAPSGGTIPFAKQTSSLKAAGLDLDAAPSGGTIPFAQRTPAPSSPKMNLDAAPSGSTIPFAQGPSTRTTGSPRPPSSAAPISNPARGPNQNLESMLSDVLSRPEASKSEPRPPSKASTRPASRSGDKNRPKSDPRAAPGARPKSNDPMALLDEPSTPSPSSNIDQMLRQARERLEFADHSGALKLVEQVLAVAPLNTEALALQTRCEATLTSMYESKLGNLMRKPKLRLRPDEVIWLNLDHRAGFVLAQIDGQLSLDDLFDLSGMSRLDTARILAQLVEEKVIQL